MYLLIYFFKKPDLKLFIQDFFLLEKYTKLKSAEAAERNPLDI